MKIGLDIHGVLDKHPQKYISLANLILDAGSLNFTVDIITGPTKSKALKELNALAKKYNGGIPFWDEVYSIVDYIIEEDIPHYFLDNGHLWTYKKDDWDKVKGIIAKELDLDFHFDNTPEYAKFFNPGIFCLVKDE